MAHVDYSAAGIPVRDDLTKTHAELLGHLRAPGAWWTGAERVAIAAESRHALDCAGFPEIEGLRIEASCTTSPAASPGGGSPGGSDPRDASTRDRSRTG